MLGSNRGEKESFRDLLDTPKKTEKKAPPVSADSLPRQCHRPLVKPFPQSGTMCSQSLAAQGGGSVES